MSFAYFKQTSFALAMALLFNTQTVLAGNVNPKANNKKAASQSQGGGDTGGGNAKTYMFTPIDEYDLKIAIKLSTTLLKQQLWSEEVLFKIMKENFKKMAQAGAVQVQVVNRIYEKFYSNKGSTVFDKLKTIKFHTQNEACMDDGEANDASYENGIICLSLDRLKAKLSQDTVYPQLRGLLFHELAHAMGEVHAKPKKAGDDFDLLRDFVSNSRSSDFVSKFIDSSRDFRGVISDLIGDYKEIVGYLEQKDVLRACMNLAVLEKGLRKYNEDVSVFGIRIGIWAHSRREFVNLQFASLQTSWAMNEYCNGSDSSVVGQRYVPPFLPPFVKDYFSEFVVGRTILHVGAQDSVSALSAMKEVGAAMQAAKLHLEDTEESIQAAFRGHQ